MNDKNSLKSYIECNFPEVYDKISNQNHPYFFNHLINSTIIKSYNNKKIKNQNFIQLESCSYVELIDYIINFLLLHDNNNVLINGYLNSSSNTISYSNIINPFVSFHCNFLKDYKWNYICNILGNYNFVNLIFNTNCFVKLNDKNFIQIFGQKNVCITKDINSINFFNPVFLTDNKKRFKSLFLDSTELMSDIYLFKVTTKRVPKKFRKFKKLLDIICVNFKKRNFIHIIKHINYISKINQNFQNSTPFDLIIKFVLTVINKNFPLEIWGTEKNRSLIIKKIVNFLKHGMNPKLSLNVLLFDFKITDIEWLGKTKKITSKQDFQMRFKIFSKFIKWFFFTFITILIKSFWKVVKNVTSESIEHLYFFHSVWSKLTNEWLFNYKKNYLISIKKIDLNHNIKLIEKYNFGMMKLIPKSKEFRLLCIPNKFPIGIYNNLNYKNILNNNFEYYKYSNEIVESIKQIIIFKRNKVRKILYPQSKSINSILENIKKYKLSLLKLYDGEIPKTYGLKFDIKQCYDNLSQKKIIKCIEKLFENDDNKEIYYVRHYIKYTNLKMKYKKYFSIVNDSRSIQDFNIFNNQSNLSNHETNYIVDKTKTFKFTKQQVMDFCKMQIFDSFVIPNFFSKCVYKRKKGIFQGFPLLALFCDILYDSMIEKIYDTFRFENKEILLLRLVDDFLFLTPNLNELKKFIESVNNIFIKEYGAVLNEKKTQLITSNQKNNFLFYIGLRINLKNFNVVKNHQSSMSVSLEAKKSFVSMRKYLISYFNTQLDSNLLSIDLNSKETILLNFKNILVSVLKKLKFNCKFFSPKDKVFKTESFKTFLIEIFYITINKFKSANNFIGYFYDILEFFKLIVTINLKKNLKFKQIISWIKNLNL